jgi:hypothetical protein
MGLQASVGDRRWTGDGGRVKLPLELRGDMAQDLRRTLTA